jgi:osmoprotectant transport system ATP-binding protein
LISFDHATKTYPDGTVAVDDLTVQIPAGSFTVFVGPSGCGKTTSMRMINRMVAPTSGTVLVDGADVSTVDPVKLRLGIGYVIQSAGLMPHQRVIDNVATVPVLRGQTRRAARRDAYRVLEQVGLDPKLATRYPAQLSGGEQQRVGVARALAADPPILLMDEPFSAVDPVVRRDLQREMLRLQAELHKTIVFVTHDIDEAVRLADLIAVFGPGGSLQQYDEVAQLLSRPANEFVSKFVGAGRGYRWLQRLNLTGLKLHDIPQICEADLAAGHHGSIVDGWLLVINGNGTPLGWIDTDGIRRHRGGAPLSDSLAGVGALLRPDGNLSQALDCALSSPAAMGVAVDSAGKVVGGVLAADVVTALNSRKAEGQA